MEGRRRITLYDQMTAGNSSRDSLASLMLDDVVFKNTEAAEASRELSRSRTLQDIIRKEEPNNNNNNSTKDRNSWRALKEKLGLKRTIGSSTNSNYNKDDNDTNLPETRPDLDASTQQNDAVVEDVNDSDPIAQLESDEAALGVPLMDLLEETEQEMDLYGMSDDDDDDVTNYEKGEEQQEGVQEVGGLVEYNCCVCMVRHKGAAFIPCGHTFCRMCSREIWVSRGNCPLCNNLILEILDIF